jgi:hypothetical protein
MFVKNNLLFKADHSVSKMCSSMHRYCTKLTVSTIVRGCNIVAISVMVYSSCIPPVSQNPGVPWALSGVPHAYFLDDETDYLNNIFLFQSSLAILVHNQCWEQVLFFIYDTTVPLHHLLTEGAYLTEGWGQLKAILEKRNPGKYVETEPCTRHSDYQTAYVSQMPNSLCPNQGQQDLVILLTLILVDRGHLINKLMSM